MQLRDNRLDSLKGFLIILVILGHLIGQIGYGNGDLNWEVRTFIYTFHMPLFILISGYFTKIEVGKILFVKGLMKLAIPLVVFQIISMLFVYIWGGAISVFYVFSPLLDFMVSFKFDFLANNALFLPQRYVE